MEIEVLNKKYEVLEIIPKKHEEHDLFVCKASAGYKECFHRMDIGRELKEKKIAQAVAWTREERKLIIESLKNGLSTREISKLMELNRHTESAIRSEVLRIKTKMKYEESKPRFNIKF